MYCTALYCTVLYCTVLYCTVLYCNVMYCTVLYCNVLYFTVLYCTVLYCIEQPCFNFQYRLIQSRFSHGFGDDSEPKEIATALTSICFICLNIQLEMNPEISAKQWTEFYTSTETRMWAELFIAFIISFYFI